MVEMEALLIGKSDLSMDDLIKKAKEADK